MGVSCWFFICPHYSIFYIFWVTTAVCLNVSQFSVKKKLLFQNLCYLWTWYIELEHSPVVILSRIIFICSFWGILILEASVVLFSFHYFLSGCTISMSAQYFFGEGEGINLWVEFLSNLCLDITCTCSPSISSS